ncbi:hypothetical protein [Curtobacterium sp. NPDC086286]|jgi:hypothetical protein|uniref:hypothetical protein n=1 Tax=Curtobacterium sp. NPDC086286 TaxID=3363964 RepID=UPI0037F15EFA
MTNKSTTLHTAQAYRDGNYWLIDIDGKLRTQAARVKDIERVTRDWLSNDTNIPAKDVSVAIVITVPETAQAHLDQARELREAAADAQAKAQRESAAAAAVLRAENMTIREIGSVLGVSHQRAQQLVESSR